MMKEIPQGTEQESLFEADLIPSTPQNKRPTKVAKHIARRNALYPESSTALDKHAALRQDILAFPPQEVGAIGHIARLLAQFGLPHSDPGEGTTVYTRENGDLKFRITSQVDDGGIPWGVMPRLILAYVSTQAVLTRSKRIMLGTNLSSFLRDELGMSVTGGKNGSITRLKEQAYRLFTSSIAIQSKNRVIDGTRNGTRKVVGMMNIAKFIGMWEPQMGKNPEEVWRSAVDLSDDFYEATISAAVPIDWRIVNGIQNSPLAIDLYFWLTYRMRTVKRKTSIIFFGENSIFEQLGSGYKDTPSGRYAFKKKVEVQLSQIKFLWPGLSVHVSEDGTSLVLFPSPTSVPSLESGV